MKKEIILMVGIITIIICQSISSVVKSEEQSLKAVIDIPLTGEVLTTITFDGDGSYAEGLTNYISKYKWDFGDGSATHEIDTSSILHDVEDVYHTYWKEGNYAVTLTVWDKDGNSNSATAPIRITNTYGDSGLNSDEKAKLKKRAVEYSPALYVHPEADHNCPEPISQILDNSVLRQKSIWPDPVIDDDPSTDDLMAYSGSQYYLDENDHKDQGNHNTTYVHIRKDDGVYFIQYYFSYYFNDGPSVGDLLNNHEGDIEMIQISFDNDYNPLTATYSQHKDIADFNYGEKRDWRNVEKYIDVGKLTNHPIVYVSSGTGLHGEANSHANYFYKGDGPLSDYTDDCTKKITFNFSNGELIFLPNLEDDLSKQGENNFGWLQFAGNWGVVGVMTDDGPPGPAFCTFSNSKIGDNTLYNRWIDNFEFEKGRLQDGNNEPSWLSLELTTILVNDQSVVKGTSVPLQAYLFDSLNQPLKDKMLYFYVNNLLEGMCQTAENGRASITYIAEDIGQQNLTVVFAGDPSIQVGVTYYSWCDEKAALTISDVVQTFPEIEWSRTFGGSSGTDIARSVQQTTDGGYIIAGMTQSYGPVYYNDPKMLPFNAFVVKTDDEGNEIWNKIYGRSISDDAESILQTSDGGYIIAGSTYSYATGQPAIWIIKTDVEGNEIWNKMFEGDSDAYIGSIQQTTDGGYIIAGTLNSAGKENYDVWLIKTDDKGNEIWNNTFGGVDMDWGEWVQQTTDGGYIIAGNNYSSGAGSSDVWLIKTHDSGNEIWSKTFGGADSDYAESVQQTDDGGYIIVGYTESYGAGDDDIWLIKADSDGNEKWNKTFGGPKSDGGHSVQQTDDGGYIIGGWTYSYGSGIKDIWLIKTDGEGEKIWAKTFGRTDFDSCRSIQQTTDGGYIIAGSTEQSGGFLQDFLLMKIKLSPVSPSDQSSENGEGSTPGFELLLILYALASVIIWKRKSKYL